MIFKAFCIMAASYSYAMMLLPPKSSRSVWTSKTDKIKKETSFLTKPCYAYTMTALTLFWAALYLLVMAQSAKDKSSSKQALHQLGELKAWHVVMTIVAVASYMLRIWSFRTLDWFFTYQLTIRPGHRLVTSGPYKILRHPSYTGFFFNCVAVWTMLWHNGLFEILAGLLSRSCAEDAPAILQAFTPLLPVSTCSIVKGLLGVNGGFLVVVALSWITAKQVMERVDTEEKMLKDHFGKEWDAYTSKRWRFIPFVY